MRIESAKLIAELEERRLNDFFEVAFRQAVYLQDEVKELNRKMEDYATTKRASAESKMRGCGRLTVQTENTVF